MACAILYVDPHRSKSIEKALARHGKVQHACDINEALFLIVEHEFEYYFIDADTPQAQAFILHLGHDPQLPPPSGVVLLTDNDDEDCEAWAVDTFVTKSRAREDLPYVFSHLRGEPFKKADVVHIARPVEIEPTPAVITARERNNNRPKNTAPGNMRVRRQGKGSGDLERELPEKKRKPVAREAAVSGPRVKKNGVLRLAALALFILAITIWVFASGPFRGSSARLGGEKKEHGASSDKRARGSDAGDSSADGQNSAPGTLFQYVGTAPAAGSSTADADASTRVNAGENPPSNMATSPEMQAEPTAPGGPSPSPSPANEPAPAPATSPPPPPVNHAPSASISGPQFLRVDQTGTWTLSGSDPDGDSLSYSWRTKSMAWSGPGNYEISGTVTDSRGESASASISVQVEP